MNLRSKKGSTDSKDEDNSPDDAYSKIKRRFDLSAVNNTSLLKNNKDKDSNRPPAEDTNTTNI